MVWRSVRLSVCRLVSGCLSTQPHTKCRLVWKRLRLNHLVKCSLQEALTFLSELHGDANQFHIISIKHCASAAAVPRDLNVRNNFGSSTVPACFSRAKGAVCQVWISWQVRRLAFCNRETLWWWGVDRSEQPANIADNWPVQWISVRLWAGKLMVFLYFYQLVEISLKAPII